MDWLVREMTDPLATFPKHRQPMVIRTLVCRRGVERIEIPGVAADYRSSEDIRTVLSVLRERPCFGSPSNDVGSPPVPFKNASRQRLYDALIDEFGPMCQSCGQRYGHVVDHDHFTGLVRGLLCRVCNTWVDTCVHADSADCEYAVYLNAPPAESLKLRYPASHRQRALDEVRRSILGFDVLERRSWPSSDPTDWRWPAPDRAQLTEVASNWWSQHPDAASRRRDQREALMQ